MKNDAIGVFDSGLGGLTCVRELRRVMPNESIIYFGDTGRVPYGNRSADTIRKYALEDVRFLLGKRVKMVIAACGTVSSVAGNAGEGLSVPFTGVVIPAAKAAAEATRNNRIGVIGTAATVASGSYGKEIAKLNPDAEVFAQACALFVPLVENGFIDASDILVKETVARYLKPLKDKGIDTLILGCTHYPILREAIADYMGEGVSLIDAGAATANYVRSVLSENNMLAYDSNEAKYHYYVTDAPQGFTATASLLLGEDISSQVERVAIESIQGGF